MVKPTREEILKYIKSPINLTHKMKIKKEKNFKKKSEATLFINKVNGIIKNLGNIDGLSATELNDKIDLLLVTPPPVKSRSFSPTPPEEEDRENFRESIRKQHEAAVRARERDLGLEKGALKVGSIEFPDDTGYGIKKKKKSSKNKVKSAKKKRRKSLGKKSKKNGNKKRGKKRDKKSLRRKEKTTRRRSRKR